MRYSKAVILSAAIWLGGCSTITIQPEQTSKLVTKPTYQESKSFYFWGLVGEPRVDVTEVCQEEEPKQMQSQATFLNGLLSGITLGIYSPHTVKVWCE